jgi:rubrerythrin
MRNLSLKEIIEYSEKIELESYEFYAKAKDIINEEETKSLLTLLANEETEHYNHLRGLINRGHLTAEELDAKLMLKEETLTQFINTDKIEKGFSGKQILEIALDREKKTEQLYAMLLTFTDLKPNIINVFKDLRNQEKGHIEKIEVRLKNY